MTEIAELEAAETETGTGPSVEVNIDIEGVYAVLLHNGRLSDPLDPFTKALKTLTSKMGKTDEDHEHLANLEWWGGLYLSEQETIASVDQVLVASAPKTARVIIPADVLTATIAGGARKLKLGKDMSAGVVVRDDALLGYRGPKDPNALSRDPAFRFRKSVKVGGKRVMRTRPRFEKGWTLSFALTVESDIINPSRIKDCIEMAGKYIGIGDWRPGAPKGGPFGRFIVKKCEIVQK